VLNGRLSGNNVFVGTYAMCSKMLGWFASRYYIARSYSSCFRMFAAKLTSVQRQFYAMVPITGLGSLENTVRLSPDRGLANEPDT
jgi:hypothetical protein